MVQQGGREYPCSVWCRGLWLTLVQPVGYTTLPADVAPWLLKVEQPWLKYFALTAHMLFFSGILMSEFIDGIYGI